MTHLTDVVGAEKNVAEAYAFKGDRFWYSDQTVRALENYMLASRFENSEMSNFNLAVALHRLAEKVELPVIYGAAINFYEKAMALSERESQDDLLNCIDRAKNGMAKARIKLN